MMLMGKCWGIAAGVLFTGLVAAACSSDSEESTPAPAGTLEIGAVCARSAQCKPIPGQEVECDCTPDADQSVCRVLLDYGDDCGSPVNFGAGCRSDARCVARDGRDPVCERLARIGESCEAAYCVPGATCGDDGVCAPGHEIGEACDYFELVPCKAGAHCVWDGVCEADKAAGERCESDEACGPNARCVSVSGADAVCFPSKGQGEACSASWDCDDQHQCDGGRCVPRTRPVGCGF